MSVASFHFPVYVHRFVNLLTTIQVAASQRSQKLVRRFAGDVARGIVKPSFEGLKKHGKKMTILPSTYLARHARTHDCLCYSLLVASVRSLYISAW